jgi:hypothetical protein
MDTSILQSTKKILGIPAADESFDLDVVTHINAAFSTLTDLGLGAVTGFVIDDTGDEEWDDFITGLSPVQLSRVKTFVYLSVRLAFDPPQTSFGINALQEQIREHQWRLNTLREETEWVDPEPEVVE